MNLSHPKSESGAFTRLVDFLDERGATLVPHLDELRKRLIYCLLTLVVTMVIAWMMGPAIIAWFESQVGRLIFVAPTDGLVVRFKMAFIIGLLFALPMIVFQMWKFTSPAFVPRERRAAILFITMGSVLFIAGTAFGYTLVYPAALHFLIGFSSDTLRPAIVIGDYFRFVISTTVSFGLAFQLPTLLLALVRTGFLAFQTLREWRRAAWLLAFVAGAFFTPGGVITQFLMAIPLALLYEITLLIAPYVEKREEMS